MTDLFRKVGAVCLAVVLLLSGCTQTAAESGHFTKDTSIQEVINDKAFDNYGRLMFPTDDNYYSGDTLGDLQLTWYNNINPDKTVEIVNYFYDQVQQDQRIFYPIYSKSERKADPEKADTGIFFFRGQSGAKTAVVNAGGGFAYVGAMQDSFPVALELSKKGYNAIALIYRPEEETAYEDLAYAITWLRKHADELQIDMTDYSLWGGSAGARMANRVGTDGTASFDEPASPQPAAVITQYTGLSEVTGKEPPTYANVGTDDSIADAETMTERIDAIKENGTDAEIEVFKGLEHGFGLGEGTAAEGWVDHAVSFWKKHMTTEDIVASAVNIPDSIRKIPRRYFRQARQQGTLEDLNYQTWESFSYEEHQTRLNKHAVVYLPYQYDPSQQYDVFYLMHGGWSNENSLLGSPGSPSEFKNVLDHAIQEGKLRPMIIVCPTYNNTNENGQDSDDFSLALQLTDQFHNELTNDLMPAVESKYSTYAEEPTPAGFAASRDHRGFGGFSMGSVATWHTFQYNLDDFRYFLPMSCGTDLDNSVLWQDAENRDPGDYFVFIMTGTKDFAYSYEQERHQAMEDSGVFTDIDQQSNGNFAYRVKKGYDHDATAAEEYTYNGLTAFFPSS
ncbi:alpha/beta hydrolase-fold protein [Catenisphaera adipataccumulans]|uniref:Enterochelin esterase-like enzyme/predicted esterase n=1 Tax=Catenisphaera adipataccumulans TaxID=700500 RepID=A0A7W8CYE1_9FIRM|nr:alpha/beta hydrolase-fold protein [Catenisphaera adipataccumulans]MBB5182718.1 enterochelin esterase-like enzyme/predicted esterase [Catenisphaera adipataccumulans]